jgi:hypothetical protein
VRLRSPDRIAEEVDAVASAHPVSRRVYLEVEMFGIDEQWALEVCSRLELLNRKRKSPLLFGTNFRVVAGADLERLFAACRRAHFEYVNIGLESGSEAIRREMLNRNYTNREFLECVKLAKAYGLKVHVNNLIGIPGESPEAARETIEVNRLCLPDQCRNSIFFPYPGTRLHAFCEERGLLRGVHPRDIEMERVRAALDLPGFPKRQIQKYFTWFEWHVYRGHRPTHKLLIRVLLLKIRSAPLLFLIYTKCRCSSAVNWTMDRLRRLVYDL